MKRPIAGIYSMSNLVEFEPYVDRTICFFLKRLDQIQAQADGPCDLGTWLQWFAFDVMGEVTFSRRLGFLDRAEDVEGIIGSIWRVFWYSSWVCTEHSPYPKSANGRDSNTAYLGWPNAVARQDMGQEPTRAAPSSGEDLSRCQLCLGPGSRTNRSRCQQ